MGERDVSRDISGRLTACQSPLKWLVATIALAGVVAWSSAPAQVDRVFHNANIWTGGGGDLAEAIAVKGELIVAVGASSEILDTVDEKTELIDLNGKLVVPGFIDAHTHFLPDALSLTDVKLRDAATPAEFRSRIAARAADRPGEWILRGLWDHEHWGGELPRRAWIDADTKDTPVFVERLDGHMALANSKALELAGIDKATPDPLGGKIVRDPDGTPTGLLKDTAMELVYSVVPAATDEALEEAMQLGFESALSKGITGIHVMSAVVTTGWRPLEIIRSARKEEQLPLRVFAYVAIADWQKMSEYVKQHGHGDDWLRWGGVKGFVDGSLGSSTAWFYEPYEDSPNNTGLTIGNLSELKEDIRGASAAGLHVAVHAIGRRANDWVLDVFNRLCVEHPNTDYRFRIEHAQHLTVGAIGQFSHCGIIASMQPYHAIDDGRWAIKRIGADRLEGTYAFRSLEDAGVRLAFGSDWAVAPLDPLMGIYAAVTRRTIDGKNRNGWMPQEKITVSEALTAYTVNNAYAGFQEDKLGRLAPGMLADFVVLSENLFEIKPESIDKVDVLRTVVAGKDAYVRPEH